MNDTGAAAVEDVFEAVHRNGAAKVALAAANSAYCFVLLAVFAKLISFARAMAENQRTITVRWDGQAARYCMQKL